MLFCAYQLVTNRVLELVNKNGKGLDIRDVWVVLATGKGGGLNQKQLAKMLGINENSMVKIVNKLEGFRVVRRESRPGDRRNRVITLTNSGTDLCKRLEGLLEMFHYKVLEPLTNQEVDLLQLVLNKLLSKHIF